ncbi:MAG: Mannosylfructose-phosphate phosphatase [Alphaproteobacteria bacterium ADurb.Bin438]|nr:MAG: Mannosylfructose-phosphate phosphatase [Alphaproteobacteria bacterium ADurb.Bin438]
MKKHDEFSIVYSSGRTIESMLSVIEEFDLPKPLYIIGAIGTEIFDYKNQVILKEWEDFIKDDKWNPSKIMEIITNLELQPLRKQTKNRICYYLSSNENGEVNDVARKLEENDINADVVYSSNKFLDIVPKGANKGSAGIFICDLLNLDLKKVVISGDSGNDLDMFKENFGFKIAPYNIDYDFYDNIKGMKNFYLAKKDISYGIVEGLEEFLKQKREI